MQAHDLNLNNAGVDAVVNDLGPLAWVLDELRKSLDGSAKALKRFVREAEASRGSDLATLDSGQLRIARQQMHQAVGALEMVGLTGPALVLRAMESVVQKFVQYPEQCSQDAAAKIENASFALIEYLESVLAEKPVSPVSLFPQYRLVQELVKADRIHPADLWPMEWRWLEPQLRTQAVPRSYDALSRTTFDQLVLQIMRGQAPQAAADLKALSLGFSARQTDRQARIFWQIAAAYFEALEHSFLPPDVYVRRASSRVLLQYAALSKGDAGISDRLAQDLLFFCSQVDAPVTSAPVLSAVRAAYSLDRFKAVNYDVVLFGRFDPALLAQARKRIASAKEAWSALTAGDVSKFKAVADQFGLVTDSLVNLHPASEPLAQALTRAIDTTSRSGQLPSIELAMEVATSVLYLEAAFDDLDPSDGQLAARTKHLAERLDTVRSRGAAQPLAAWMEELYRRVSDKHTMGSVVGELRVSLGELEKLLDIFFRNPKDKVALSRVPGQLSQMRGVLSVLGLDQASQAVLRMREAVEHMLAAEIGEDDTRAAGTFDQLGNNLGALSFLIDMLNYQPALAKKLFVYDDVKGELRPVMGRAEKTFTVAPVADAPSQTLSQEVSSLMQDADSRTSDDALGTKLSTLATHAALAGQPVLARAAHEASLAVSTENAEVTASALSAFVTTVAPAEVSPIIRVEDVDLEEDDLRNIFLDEAREVVTNGQEALVQLGADPGDINQLTILRRVFHTLKGSARMVGLNEFGEAAWTIEQLFNSWLADQKPASHGLLSLSTDALGGFSRWIADIAAGTDGAWVATAFGTSAEAMQGDGRLVPLVLPQVAVAADARFEPATSVTEPSVAVVDQVAKADAAAAPSAQEPDFEFFDFEQAASQPLNVVAPPPLEQPLAQSNAPYIEGIDFESLSAIPGALPATTGVEPSTTGTFVEIEDLGKQFEDFDSQSPADGLDGVDLAAPPPDVDSSRDMSASAFEAEFLDADFDLVDLEMTSAEVAPASGSGFEDALAFSEGADKAEDEKVKVIGSLRIGIPLYNVYLNEADEWSRRLLAEVTEWAMEPSLPVDDSVVSFAHSLAGSSATVGFKSLSEIARALENALQLSQSHFSHALAAQCADVFVKAAEEIRRLLHQFAAGFLKESDPNLLLKIRALEFPESDPEFVSTAGDVGPDMDFGAASSLAQDSKYELPAVAAEELLRERSSVVQSLDAPFIKLLRSADEMQVVAATQQPAQDNFVVSAVPTALKIDAVPSLAEPGDPDVDDEIDSVDAIDAELFPIFDEESMELMPQLGGALRQWSVRPDNLGARMEVLRNLHTLKGSARLAGALRLGEMAHRIESEIEFLGTEAAASQNFEPLLNRFDAMQHALDLLRKADAMQAMPISTIATASAPLVDPADATTPTPTQIQADEDLDAAGNALPVEALPTESIRLRPVALRPEVGRSIVPAPQTMAMQPLRQAATASVRVRSQLLDRMVNQAGEVMITRSRLEVELSQLRGSLSDMNDNLNRLRQHLRDIELQAETQMQSRLAQAKENQAGFDPLEFDRFTRVQELTRMMAESVNDVATVQRTLQRTVDATEDDLVAQARQTRELQRDLLKTRMVEFEGISDRLYRVVRLASKETGKQVKLDLLGATIEMDRGMLDRMTPAFEHLLRNCVAHGIESPAARVLAGKDAAGLITIELRQEGNDVSVEFRDDGAGLDLKRIREKAISSGLIASEPPIDDVQAADLIFMPGFSTAEQVTALAGRGIGMDVVRAEVNAVGGRIEIATNAGLGTQFKLVLPLTTAVTQVVMIRSGSLTVGIPSNVVETVRRTAAKDLQQAYNTGTLDVGGEAVPFFWSGALLQASAQSLEVQGKTTPVVVFRSAAQRLALHVDEVLGNQEVVVKNLGPQLSRLPGLAGMSLLASGAVVLIYNPVALAAVYGVQARALSGDSAEPHMLETSGGTPLSAAMQLAEAPLIPLIMVVDDSITVRRVTQRLLQREGYRVVLAADGLQALERLQEERPAVVLSDIEMPRMDGFDLARNIRADSRLKNLPIVMITSRIAGKHREHAKELGVDHYLGKPYAEEELMSLVRHYCSAEPVI